MNEIFDNNTIKAIKNLANGMILKEVTEEYAVDDKGEMKLIKKKVNEKMLPPNTDICKMLYSSAKSNENSYKTMTDEELEIARQKFLKEIQKEERRKNENRKCGTKSKM